MTVQHSHMVETRENIQGELNRKRSEGYYLNGKKTDKKTYEKYHKEFTEGGSLGF